jgi:HK97 family phage prohead protease
MSKITKAFPSDIKVSEGERAVTAVISTAAVDRDGEVLIPQGCNSKDFEKNPCVFLGHNYYSLPVGKVVSIKRDTDKLVAKVVFAERPENHANEWVPDTLLSLFQQKVLNGFSVGFIPQEQRPATDRDLEKFGAGCRRVFSKWSLLELSVAPLPANQEAVALAVSKGIINQDFANKVLGADETAPEAIPVPQVSKHVVMSIQEPAPEAEPVKAVRKVHRILQV